MRKCLQVLIGVLVSITLAGCIPIKVPDTTTTPLPTATIPVTGTATATIVWFPATATFTPFPTQLAASPTPDLRPGIGRVLLQDDFSSGEDWSLDTNTANSVALGKNELTIAISQPRTYLFSLRNEPILTDFYVEITATPTLCRDLDEYGLLIRAASEVDYFRFSLSCNGQVRLDRVLNGSASSPQPWTSNSGSLPGAELPVRLGVWAVGGDMRFFVNDIYQFAIHDATIPSGRLGIFARSAGDLAVTVNFSALMIWQVTD